MQIIDGETVKVKGNGRPRVNISAELVLNAYGQYRSIRAAACFLNISSGTAWQRLKEVGVTPLGMSRSEAGKFGAKLKAIEKAVRAGDLAKRANATELVRKLHYGGDDNYDSKPGY